VLTGAKYDGGVAQQALANAETVLQILNHNTLLVTVMGSGNVGIGTSSPASKLTIGGNTSIGVAYTGVSAPTNGLIVQRNVGIGTTLPRNGLEVNVLDSNYITSMRIGGALQGTTGTASNDEQSRNQLLFSSWRDIQSDSVGAKIVALNLDIDGNSLAHKTDLAFFTNPLPTSTDSTVERMRITSGGNVGIGTSSPASKLTIGGNTSIGVAYTGVSAPTNGLIVQGNVGIGHTNPGYMFSAWGSSNAATAPLYSFINRGTGSSIAVLKIGVGSTTASNARLISFYSGVATDTGGSGVGSIRLAGTTGVQYLTNAADFGEYFTKGQDDLVTGDVVALDSQGRVVKAITGQTPVGVVSNNAGFVGNSSGDEENPNKIIVGLLGQVATKVDPDSDPIQPGDALAPSTRAGYVRKAQSLGPTVGTAIEVWNPHAPTERINTYVRGSWYDPDLYLTSTGDLHTTSNTGPFVYNGNLGNDTNGINNGLYTLLNSSGQVINRIGSFSEIVAAKIKTGYLSAENALIKNTLVAKNITSEQISAISGRFDQLLISQKIQTPIAEIDTLTTNEIQPKDQDVIVNLQPTTDDQEPTTENGRLAALIIKGLKGKTVASIDSAGNATFSGTLAAQTVVSDQLSANEASISGKLVAKEIQSDNINSIQSSVISNQEGINKLTTDNQQLTTNINDVQALLADLQNQPLPDPQYYQSLPDDIPLLSTGSATLASLITDSLTVSGQSNLYNLSVSNSAMVGTLLMQDNTLLSLSSELKLSALNSINIFDGQVTIAKNGTITTNGSIIAKGGIKTNEIKSIDGDGLSVVLNANQGSLEKLKIKNNLGAEVATINASGSAYFKDGIAFDKYLEATSSASIASAADTFAANGIFSPSIKTESQTAGVGLMPTGSPEILIYNEKVTDDSLIYVTATSPTFGKSLYLAQKQSCQPQTINCKPYFKVAIDGSTTSDIHFNWWIVN